MESRFPDLVKEATRVLPIQKIAEILQRVVSEDISVRNLRAILESLIEWGAEREGLGAAHRVCALHPQAPHQLQILSGQNVLAAYLFAPNVEDTVRSAIRQNSAGSYLALDPAVSKQLVENIKRGGRHRCELAAPGAADGHGYPALHAQIEQDLYDLPVLSYQELTQEINIQPLARIDL